MKFFTRIMLSLLFVAGITSNAQERIAPPSLSSGAVERKVLGLEEQSKQAQIQLQSLQQIKARLGEALGRLDLLSYPSMLEEGISSLKRKVEAEELITAQVVYGEASQLVFQFNQRLGSIAPDIPNQYLPRNPGGGSSVREQIIAEIFADSNFADITVPLKFPFVSSSDQRLSEQGKQSVLVALASIGEAGFNNKKSNLRTYIQKKLEEINARIAERSSEIKLAADGINSLYENLDKSQKAQSRIDEALVQYGIPAIAIAMLALLLAPVAYRSNQTQNFILQSGVLVQIFTIFLLTSTILLLGFANKIDSNSLGTLLGGIAGYVLGRTALTDRAAPHSTTQPISRDNTL